MTLPGLIAAPPTAAPEGFSKEFVSAGIEAMAEQREWRAALKSAIESIYPISDSWLSRLRARAEEGMRRATAATSTNADKNALPFLINQFNNVNALSDKYLKMAVSMAYIDPNSLANDVLDQKITTCSQSLLAMATANQFVDDGSCR
jgi:hypothetical protein